jgi:diguanylate cyclase (GGDEF)-like protein
MQQEVLDRVRASEDLPTLPGVAVEVLNLARRDDVSVGELAQVIYHDPALTAKILKVVNSSLFGIPKEIASLNQAVGMLGLRTIRVLALSFSLVDSLSDVQVGDFDYERYWKRSLNQAIASRLIAMAVDKRLSEDAFVAGLLSDIGMVAAWRTVPDLYAKVLEDSAEHGLQISEIELRALEVTHATIGRELLKEWGLPENVCSAVAAHHGEGIAELFGTERRLATIVFSASLIAGLFCNDVQTSHLNKIKAAVVKTLDIAPETLEEILEGLDQYVREAASMFSLQIGATTNYAALRARASLDVARLSLETEVDRVKLARQAEQAQDELNQVRKQAAMDSLTGLWNRGAILELLDQEIARAARSKSPIAVMLMDLDNFKKINDTYGHVAGDQILRTAAERLQGSVRRYDSLGRYGGEEFIAVLPGCGSESAATCADRMRRSVGENPIQVDSEAIEVTVSIGCAIASDAASADPISLIRSADEALYKAKNNGRNSVEIQ